MQQLLSIWTALEPRRRVIVIGATIFVFVAVLMLGRMAAAPGMALLYGGLESAAAGEVVQVLEQRGILYEVRGDAIYVPQRIRDETRMTLAGQGLPANSSAGYELLDGLSGFGTTSQMFDAAYWRAKEGELARTIVASPHIRTARVHIAQTAQQPFRREIAPTASVTVSPVAGGLPPGQARSLRFLVASAVAGLRPEDVSIIDGVGGSVVTADDTGASASSGGDREAALRSAVERLLAAHVGPGRAVVEVSVDTVTETESIIERRLDPDGRVVAVSDTEERNSTSSDARSAGVTVASNLPDGDGANDGGQSRSQNSETRERTTYELSETQRELLRVPGSIRRLTVAVLIDGLFVPDETGALLWRPRSEEELDALRELVGAAVGFDAARGDVITLKSLPFEPVESLGSPGDSGLFDRLSLDMMSLIQLAVLAVLVLALIFFVIRPAIASARAGGRGQPLPGAQAAGALAGPGGDPSGADADGFDNGFPVAAPMPLGAFPAIGDMGMGSTFDGGSDRTGRAEDEAVARLRRLIEERQEETVEILRGWMEDGEEEKV